MGRGGGILGHLPPAPPVSRRMVRGEKGEEINKEELDRQRGRDRNSMGEKRKWKGGKV